MPNINAPFGLKPVKMSTGVQNIPLAEYTVADGYTTKIHKGTPVKLTGTGRNVIGSGVGEITIGTFEGCKYTDVNGEVKFSDFYPGDASATGITCLVADSPATIFWVRTDSLAAADVGTFMDWAVGTPNDLYGRSGYVLTNASKGTSNGNVRVLGLAPVSGNEYGNYAIAEVTINEHQYNNAAGAGV